MVDYPFGKTVPLTKPIAITNSILWFRMPLPMVLTHVNIWLFKDNNGYCCFDTGIYWDKGIAFWDEILKDYPLTKQCVTHGHSDHMSMAGYLNQKTGAPLYITQREFDAFVANRNQIKNYSVSDILSFFISHGLDEIHKTPLLERGSIYQKTNPPLPSCIHPLVEDEIILINDTPFRVFLGSGHSISHASFYCEKDNILCGGDMMLPSILTSMTVTSVNPHANPLKAFLTSLLKYNDLPDDVLVLPAHGRPFKNIRQRIAFLKDFHEKRLDAVLKATQKPVCARDIWPILFEKEMIDPLQYFIAMGESIAFLNYLWLDGQIKREMHNNIYYFIKS